MLIYNLKKIINFIVSIKYVYLIRNSFVRCENGASINISKSSSIKNSKIFICKNSRLIIEDNCIINHVNLFVKGEVIISKFNILERGYFYNKLNISIDGFFYLGTHNRIRSIINVRYNGILKVGNHNNINEETEIRCDESITIGSYNQISYKCIIWDTNTHNIYSDEHRRDLTEKHYPIFGYEYEKPATKPIVIKNDCWIGREAVILKGVVINNSSIIGFRTTVSNCEISDNKIVVSKINNKIIDRYN